MPNCTATSRRRPRLTLQLVTPRIVTYCESLRTFPLRGAMRDDARLGLRITNYRKRAAIAFDVAGDLASIIGVFYGGQDYETILHDDADDEITRSLALKCQRVDLIVGCGDGALGASLDVAMRLKRRRLAQRVAGVQRSCVQTGRKRDAYTKNLTKHAMHTQ